MTKATENEIPKTDNFWHCKHSNTYCKTPIICSGRATECKMLVKLDILVNPEVAPDPLALNVGGSLLPNPQAKGSVGENPYLFITEPPDYIVQLRMELEKQENNDIFVYASLARDFSEILSRIALKLNVALDGEYDAKQLVEELIRRMRNRRILDTKPTLLLP